MGKRGGKEGGRGEGGRLWGRGKGLKGGQGERWKRKEKGRVGKWNEKRWR